MVCEHLVSQQPSDNEITFTFSFVYTCYLFPSSLKGIYFVDQYMKVSKLHLEQLHTALQQEELFEQDKDLLWVLRYEIRERFPHHLSKLLQAVKWSSHVDVAKVDTLYFCINMEWLA